MNIMIRWFDWSRGRLLSGGLLSGGLLRGALTVVVLSLFPVRAACQIESTEQTRSNSVLELYMGADLNYRDILYWSRYEVLLNLTPGAKWNIGPHTQLSAQAIVPVINQYGDYYGRVRLDNLSLSHQLKIGRLALKPSAGLFTMERYGIDLKAIMPVTEWLAFESQLGVTGFMSMATGWEMSPMGHITALAGADVVIPAQHIKFRLIGGRFLKDDNGLYCECMRHFRHTTVGAYLQYSDNPASDNNKNGGFKIIVALPPYRQSGARVRFRPASNFRFTNNMGADARACKIYMTDPEENERHGWFAPDILPWAGNVTDWEP